MTRRFSIWSMEKVLHEGEFYIIHFHEIILGTFQIAMHITFMYVYWLHLLTMLCTVQKMPSVLQTHYCWSADSRPRCGDDDVFLLVSWDWDTANVSLSRPRQQCRYSSFKVRVSCGCDVSASTYVAMYWNGETLTAVMCCLLTFFCSAVTPERRTFSVPSSVEGIYFPSHSTILSMARQSLDEEEWAHFSWRSLASVNVYEGLQVSSRTHAKNATYDST